MQSSIKPTHPWLKVPFEEYLYLIEAAGYAEKDGKLHPTAAGLLMFGEEPTIVREFPEYFLDYREMLDPVTRWTDRLVSSSGEWTGNVFDFYFRVYNSLIQVLRVPFKMEGGIRIDDTPMHKALREALANCLVNTDYFLPQAVVIKLYPEKIVMENPGSVRCGKQQMLRGGISDPRNKALMKMFNLINIGERAGSGVPDIFSIWYNEGLKTPEVLEKYGPDRTILVLSLEKAISNYNLMDIVSVQEKEVLELLEANSQLSYVEIANALSVSRKTISVRIRSLKEKGYIKRIGSDRKGYWKLSS